MRHFALEAWADYVNGLGDTATRERMTGHLAAGCPRCQDLVGFLKGVADVIRRDAADEVPEWAVQRALALFEAPRPAAAAAPAVVARCVFDSLSEPLPVGIRAEKTLARRIVFETAESRIDLRIESGGTVGFTRITGQVTESANGTAVPAVVTVHRLGDAAQIVRATTNAFGEFLVELDQTAAIATRIRFLPVDGRSPVDVILANLRAGDAQPGRRTRRRQSSPRGPLKRAPGKRRN